MRVSREKAAESRERILEAAARGFRERGLDGIGVADVMKDAGFTHGGFYAHFDSKEELMAEACGRALDGSLARWRKLQATSPESVLPAVADHYLSPRHLADRANGCTIAALATDVARHGPGVRSAVTSRFRALMSILADAMPGRTRAARRRKALAAFLAAGLGTGLYLLVSMFRFAIVSRAAGGHIEYDSPHFFIGPVIAGYLAATCVSMLFSSHKAVKLFGIAALLSFVASYAVYTRWFFSIWCFFAAILSGIVFLHLTARASSSKEALNGTAL